MDGVATAGLCDFEHAIHVEVGLRAFGAKVVGFVGVARVQRIRVVGGINGDGAKTKLGRTANNPDGDLATVSDEKLVQCHRPASSVQCGYGGRTGKAPRRSLSYTE